ncbi:hypothetical protein H920_15597 [Fukomys damarensis]|uniref:Uncharacterized protein n=1 Tax=Fukomys damarensis TaxID=885580 RepID=A0A091CU53_FUKDA|nr:hypothetical protein H920_15597 [Fukomys damarensis]
MLNKDSGCCCYYYVYKASLETPCTRPLSCSIVALMALSDSQWQHAAFLKAKVYRSKCLRSPPLGPCSNDRQRASVSSAHTAPARSTELLIRALLFHMPLEGPSLAMATVLACLVWELEAPLRSA